MSINLSDSERLITWSEGIKSIWKHPILGWGWDNFYIAVPREHLGGHFHRISAHNDFIQVGVALGIVGLLVYAWLNLEIWQKVKKDALLHSLFWILVVQSKVNPLPLAPYILFALLLGNRHKAKLPTMANGVVRGALILIVLVLGNRLYADSFYGQSLYAWKHGRFFEGLQNAPRVMMLAPTEITYRVQYARKLMVSLAYLSKEEYDKTYPSIAYLIREGKKYHPNHPLMKETELEFKKWKAPSVGRETRKGLNLTSSRKLSGT